MSRLLALDLDHGLVHLASGTVRGGVVRLESAHTVPLGEPLSLANAADLGRQLREAMKSAGIAPAPVVAAIGRDRVILKDIKIPQVSPADEPALVRFQASKDMTEAAESIVLDYYTLDRPDPDGQVRAVVASVRKEVLNAYKAFANAAGLKLVGLTPRPLGTMAALDRAIATGSVTAPEIKRSSVAMLTRGDKWGELLIARDGQPVFSRTISSAALNSEPMFLGELRRNLAVFNGQNPQQSVEGVYIAEATGAAGGWSGRIRAGLPVAVQAFDPLEGLVHATAAESRGHFAALVGMLQLKAKGGPLSIDFTSPRQPIIKKAINTPLLVTAVSLLALCLVGGLVYGYVGVQKKQARLAQLVKIKTENEKALKDMAEDSKRINTLKDWDDMRINWLDELFDLAARFPDINGTRLEQFRAEPLTPVKNAQIKNVARLFLKVQTESGRFMDQFQSALVTDKRYHNINKQIKGGAGTGAFTRFNQSYELRVDIEKRPSDEYNRKLAATVPPRPTRGKVDFESTGGKKANSGGSDE